MLNNYYQGTPITFPATTDVIVSQSFNQAYHTYVRDCISTNIFPAYAGATISMSAWINTMGLVGHPVGGGYAWNTSVGVVFTSTLGVVSYVAIGTVLPGNGWTPVMGTIVVPNDAATMQPWIQIDQMTNLPANFSLVTQVNYTMSFKGRTILPMPATNLPKQLEFEIGDAVGETVSPFTLGSQSQAWPGAESWTCNVSLPPMSRSKADAWIGWFMGLNGITNWFQMGDSSHTVATGNVAGNPMVDGSSVGYNMPMSYFLHTKGWTANTANVLLPGDYIQIGFRLHRVTQVVNSDNFGKATFLIWPSIREQPGDNQDVITTNTQGVWRLVDNKRAWVERPTKSLGLAFKVCEGR